MAPTPLYRVGDRVRLLRDFGKNCEYGRRGDVVVIDDVSIMGPFKWLGRRFSGGPRYWVGTLQLFEGEIELVVD